MRIFVLDVVQNSKMRIILIEKEMILATLYAISVDYMDWCMINEYIFLS